jgi:hypothetical protein
MQYIKKTEFNVDCLPFWQKAPIERYLKTLTFLMTVPSLIFYVHFLPRSMFFISKKYSAYLDNHKPYVLKKNKYFDSLVLMTLEVMTSPQEII